MVWMRVFLAILMVVAACIGAAYVSLRQKTRSPRAGDLLVETVRMAVAMAIFVGCLMAPVLLLDLKSDAGMLVMITAVFWGPLLMFLGAVLAWGFLAMTKTEPNRTIGDLAREKAEEEARRNQRP